MTYKDFLKKIGENNAKKLSRLCEIASKKKGLKVKVRTYTNVCGDFCIFIYDKRVKPSYMVGFDGYFDSIALTIDFCIKEAIEWVETYKYSCDKGRPFIETRKELNF